MYASYRILVLLCFSVMALLIVNQTNLSLLVVRVQSDTPWLSIIQPAKVNITLLFIITSYAAEEDWRATLRKTFLSTPSHGRYFTFLIVLIYSSVYYQ
jgi:hypothetical protein